MSYNLQKEAGAPNAPCQPSIAVLHPSHLGRDITEVERKPCGTCANNGSIEIKGGTGGDDGSNYGETPFNLPPVHPAIWQREGENTAGCQQCPVCQHQLRS